MVIYADVLFIINFFSAIVMLYMTLRIMNTGFKNSRLILSALVSALLSTVLFCVGIPVIAAYAVRIFMPFLAIMITVGWHKRCVMAYYFVSVAALGVCTLLCSVRGSAVVMKNGIMYADVSIWTLAGALIFSYITVNAAARIFKRCQNRRVYHVEVFFRKKSVSFKAIFDSANFVCEPISKRPVTVVEWEALKGLFANISYEELIENEEKYPLWLIPYKTAGNEGYMRAFLCDAMLIDGFNTGKAFIGIVNKRLSKEYGGLINNGIIIEDIGKGDRCHSYGTDKKTEPTVFQNECHGFER